MKIQEAYDRLESFRGLHADWDSYGAKPISTKALSKAFDLRSLLRDGWTPVPCSDGSVQLERHEDGVDIEILISEAELS